LVTDRRVAELLGEHPPMSINWWIKMDKNIVPTKVAGERRHLAEERLNRQPVPEIDSLSKAGINALIRELQLRQIESEMEAEEHRNRHESNATILTQPLSEATTAAAHPKERDELKELLAAWQLQFGPKGDRSISAIQQQIKDRLAMQTSLRESEERYRRLFEESPDPIFIIAPTGRILAANRAAAQMHGYTVEELLNTFIQDNCAPNCRKLEQEPLRRLLAGETLNFEAIHRRKDGSSFPVEGAATNVQIGNEICILSFDRDITARKIAEDALQRTTKFLKTTASIARIGGWELDVANGSLFWTDEMFNLCEVSADDFTPCLDTAIGFFSEHSAQIVNSAMREAVRHGTSFHLELELTTGKGRKIWTDITAQTTAENGRTVKVFGTLQDVTDRRCAEEAMRTSEQFAAVGRMSARVAHEINNPLAGISNSFLLIKDAIPEAHAHHAYVGRIEREIRRIAKIVRQMLDLYRPEQESTTEFLLDDLLRDVVCLLELGARSRRVRILYSTASSPLTVRLQEGWLRQVLFNLVQNAVDASPTAGEVHIRTEFDDHTITITVEDGGKGIEPHVRPRLFDPFFTTKSDPAGPKGLGLGLSVSKNLVSAMGGVIEVETQLSVGSKFHIRLPRAGIAAT
jgi:two-component system sporulation sensor kinase C